MHVVAETPGDQASILDSSHDATEGGDVTVTRAPNGTEFMDGDIFAYIVGNDVSICTTNLREQSLNFYLHGLFTSAELGRNAGRFELQPVGDANKLRMIAQGVKRIDLGATVQQATTSYVRRRNEPRDIIRSVGREFIHIFGNDAREIEDNLQVEISIQSDGRIRTGAHQGDARLQRLARDLVDTDGDDYTIHTKAGQAISQNEVFVKSRVRMDGHGKSVSRLSAWGALREFYSGLAETGITSQ